MTASEKRNIESFKQEVWGYYKGCARDLPWRYTTDPYSILLSELMLQQTQVSRVIPKYELFIKRFPTAKKLADASVSEVLTMWQGLGYNRRALNLKKTCEIVTKEYDSIFPSDSDKLMALPGIGQSTAGAVRAFAFNQPSVFIETNIRAVYLYHFFKEASSVTDTMILGLIAETVDQANPREWYYALYDYGTMLKAKLGKQKTDIHKQSKHYAKQSKFEGSNRQIRSNILKTILQLSEMAARETGVAMAGTLKSKGAQATGIDLAALKKSSKILAQKDNEIILKNLRVMAQEGFIVEEMRAGKPHWNIAR